MIRPEQIKEIISLYKKHGWNLRRGLLSAELRSSLTSQNIERLFKGREMIDAEINAVWFSRQSKQESIAWEIRHLNENPYAILESLGIDEDDSAESEKLKNAETRLAEYASNNKSDKNA